MPYFLMKSNMFFTSFHVLQVKNMNFLHRLMLHTAAAHAYVISRPLRFILGAMSILGHVVFI